MLLSYPVICHQSLSPVTIVTCYTQLHQISDLDLLVCQSLNEDWRGLCLAGQSLGHVQDGGGGDGPHAVDGVTPVHGHRLLHVGSEGQDVAGPDLLPVLVPAEGGRGDPNHLALQ